MSSAHTIKLCRMSGTLKTCLVFGGSLFSSSSSVSVVINFASIRGVPNSNFCSYILAVVAILSRPRQETDVVQWSRAVHLFECDGLVQPGGSSSQIFIKLFVTLDPPAGSHRQLPAPALVVVVEAVYYLE